MERSDIKFESLFFLESYISVLNKEVVLPKEYQELRNSVDLNNADLYKYSRFYLTYMYNSFARYSNGLSSEKTINDEAKKLLDHIASKIENEYVRTAELANWWNLYVNRVEDKKILYDQFMALSSNKEIQDEITAKHIELSKLDKGNPSPVFENYERFGGGTVSLTDLKGKYVF